MDRVYGLACERDGHPCHESEGAVKAAEAIRISITAHCRYIGECNVCSIAVHQGQT